MGPSTIEAELTLTPEGWARGVWVELDGAGRIARVGRKGSEREGEVLRLPGRALLPGMVNAHSHAFQRGLRGKGETFRQGAGSFWSWREAMYELVDSLDEEAVYTWSRRAFAEMRAAGITSVGEFHYVRHDRTHQGYALDEVVLRAATDVGIRLVLLSVYYRTGGIERELGGAQRRFRTATREEYWAQVDRLAGMLHPAHQALGAVAHSIRAATIEEIASLHAEAVRRGLVFHMHLEEQPAEIDATIEHYGKAPMALVNEYLTVGPHTTMVHCTHTDPADMASYLEAGGIVCICPLTEGNLGDGLADLPLVLDRGGTVCLGTDSNARISMLEEMRLLEYGQRLRTGTRGVFRDAAGAVAPALLRAATESGARSLGLEAGSIAPGRFADFAAIDLEHPSLADCTEATLLPALILGAPDEVVRATCVGGEWREHREGPGVAP